MVALGTMVILLSFKRILNPEQRPQINVMMIGRHMYNRHQCSARLEVASRIRTAAIVRLLETYGPDYELRSPCARLGTRTINQWVHFASNTLMDVYWKRQAALAEFTPAKASACDSLKAK